MKYLTKRIVSAAGCLLMLTSVASAHPGQTDADGGHWDNDTGEYHYHHGYPAHQHTNGICPYDYDDQTGRNSGTSGSTSGESISTNAENGETLYNGGLGDDGTYETAWNLGYQHGMEELCEINSDIPIELAALTSELCHTHALTGSTPYADKQSSYNDAYADGYHQAETDLYAELNSAIKAYLSIEDSDTQSYEEGYEDGYRAGLSADPSAPDNDIIDRSELGGAATRDEEEAPAVSTSKTTESGWTKYYPCIIGILACLCILFFALLCRVSLNHKRTYELLSKHHSVLFDIGQIIKNRPSKTITEDEINEILRKHQ